MLYSPRKILFCISSGFEMFKCSSGGIPAANRLLLIQLHFCNFCLTSPQSEKQQLWSSCPISRKCNANDWKYANVSTFYTSTHLWSFICEPSREYQTGKFLCLLYKWNLAQSKTADLSRVWSLVQLWFPTKVNIIISQEKPKTAYL